jgi:hypothetical protein
MANPTALYGFQPYQILQGNVFPVKEMTMASNVTVIAGEAIVLGSDGYGKIPGNTSSGIFGIAVDGVTAIATTRQKIRIVPALAGIVFKARAGTTVNVTVGYTGLVRSLKVSGSYMGVHPSYTGGSCVKILGLAPGSAWGTAAELLVTIRSSTWTGQK